MDANLFQWKKFKKVYQKKLQSIIQQTQTFLFLFGNDRMIPKIF